MLLSLIHSFTGATYTHSVNRCEAKEPKELSRKDKQKALERQMDKE